MYVASQRLGQEPETLRHGMSVIRVILSGLFPSPLGLLELPVHLPKDQREPKVAPDPDDEAAQHDDVGRSVARSELARPDVASGDVSELGDGVEQSDGDGSQSGRSRERAGHPGVHDHVASVASS